MNATGDLDWHTEYNWEYKASHDVSQYHSFLCLCRIKKLSKWASNVFYSLTKTNPYFCQSAINLSYSSNSKDHGTWPLLLNPMISWLMLDVLPDWISCRWRNKLSRALPRPLSSSPWVKTPRIVLFPTSTFPRTARRRSMNWNDKGTTTIVIIM